ncbi:MAG: type IV toxin-antitoxin system AbiEi family antitoxin domain-containing protein [Paludibacteraceae bacterium]|nr:type IV toxin-antitoxin system AbiEi family antitoxin domain-containing protein [Paludibacteraceae bacterium]
MNEIKQIFERNGGYLKISSIHGTYLHKKILKATKEGVVTRVGHGVYVLTDNLANTMIDVEKVVPNGIVSMYSAWDYYQLTTQIPSAINITVERNRKPWTPPYPPITLHYCSERLLNIGLTQATINGYTVKIYDKERSVCDAIRHRKKIGTDLAGEIMRNYLLSKDKNITKLIQYAKQLKIGTVVNQYLESIL